MKFFRKDVSIQYNRHTVYISMKLKYINSKWKKWTYTPHTNYDSNKITLAYPTIKFYFCHHTDIYYLLQPPPPLFFWNSKCPLIHSSNTLIISKHYSVFCHIIKLKKAHNPSYRTPTPPPFLTLTTVASARSHRAPPPHPHPNLQNKVIFCMEWVNELQSFYNTKI